MVELVKLMVALLVMALVVTDIMFICMTRKYLHFGALNHNVKSTALLINL